MEQFLSYNQSTVTERALQKRSCEIFEEPRARSPLSSNSEKGPVERNIDSASKSPLPVDCLVWGPLHCGESRGLYHQNFSNLQELRDIASVRWRLKHEHFLTKAD